MPSVVPLQLLVDLAPIASAIRVSSTVTVTTSSPHGMVSGAYVQMAGATTAVGTSMNGMYQITTTSGSAFTYTAAGTAGTATVGSAVISVDLMNPLLNYSGTARNSALYIALDNIAMSATGDGSSEQLNVQIYQDITLSDGPWFNLVPDQTRIRLVKADTGTTPASDSSDVLFLGMLSSVNSELSGSGLGTSSQASFINANRLLEKLIVPGLPVSAKNPNGAGSFVRATNVVTVTTREIHNYSVGQRVKISGVNGGAGTSFNGTFTIASTPTTTTFTYAQTGTNATGDTAVALTSVTRYGRSTNQIEISGAAAHGLNSQDTITLAGITCSIAAVQALVNSTFSKNQVLRVSATVLRIKLPRAVATWPASFSSGTFQGEAGITPPSGASQTTVPIIGGETEQAAVEKILGIVNQYKASDAALQRVLSTSDVTQIVASGTVQSATGLAISSGSLRAALDSISETFSGQDGKARRYYIDLAGRLNYRLVDAASQPTYATAPYSIITTGAGTPNTTTAKATLAPFQLNVSWDHEMTKSALFYTNDTEGGSISSVYSYTDAGYTLRAGAPVLDDIVEFPTGNQNAAQQVLRASKAFFLDRHKPLLTGEFELYGVGTAAFNQYGFMGGYAQTGVSSFALVPRWEPGQYVEVTCSQLGLSGMYRVEQVDWSLDSGSFTQRIKITFNAKSPNVVGAIGGGF